MLLRRVLILFVCVSYSVWAANDHTQVNISDNQAVKILILGDSLSAGYGLKQDQAWVQLLQNTYTNEKSPIQLINASISGETSGGALQRLPFLLEQHQPNWVLIEIGGNDGLRGYPIKHLKQNLTQLVETSLNAQAKVLLMEVEITPNLGKRYATMFTGTYQEVAESKKVALMPFFIRTVAANPDLMLPDGIHPNAKAQPELAQIMKLEFDKLVKN